MPWLFSSLVGFALVVAVDGLLGVAPTSTISEGVEVYELGRLVSGDFEGSPRHD